MDNESDVQALCVTYNGTLTYQGGLNLTKLGSLLCLEVWFLLCIGSPAK